ncbi:protein RST1 isoform X3 [Rhododendron vialii]|uniref:protein RST1 isoform X3 n=1 Tax=Rhododendron vialii TaxID=182163 RepID=UPI00265EB9E4|nr:protein RST1 isoform X3 [Rhododendron vialii]
MDSYSSLLDRTRAPHLSLQKFAVISIFEKLRSSPPPLNPDSDPGRDAVTQCLRSASPAVVDQSVRELCRLVKDSKFDLSRALLELQSALEGCESRFVDVFVKGLGFLVRYGFRRDSSSFRFPSAETHPFVQVLSCRREVQSELVQQVLLFIAQNKRFGMVEVCDFLRPFMYFLIIRKPYSASLSMFPKDLITSMVSMCCSFPLEALPLIKLLVGCLKSFTAVEADEFRNIHYFVDYIADAYVVVLRNLVKTGLVQEAQLCVVELLETVFSLFPDMHKHSGGVEPVVEVWKRLVCGQKELGLSYIPELSRVTLSLFITLIQSEFEHQQLSILKLLIFLFKWKSENDFADTLGLREELLFVFPIINLVSSPSKSVKQAAIDLLSTMKKLLVSLPVATKKELIVQGKFPPVSRAGDIVFRLLQHLWFQDQPSLSSSFFLNFGPNDGTSINNLHNVPKTWTSQLREYALWIVERRKSSLPISQSQEIFLAEMPLLLSAIASVLVMHDKLGSSAVDLLAVVSIMDPKLGVPLLLTVLYYNNILSGKDKDSSFHKMLLKLLGMLPSLASHPLMIPLILQTILPMLQKDAKPVLYATGTRLLCQAWEINDRVFGSLQGVLLPKSFNQFMSERNICISMAASILDVCRKNPDRGVDLILSVSACIESEDPIVQALGFQSLSYLCEADVIDFYTAWDVVSKHVLDSLGNPHVSQRACLLLRWGAMDAEAYPEAAGNVVQILWNVGTSKHSDRGSLWAKARVSAFEALTQYEVPHIQKSLPDFKKWSMELLISETDPDVLRAMEVFEVKIINYEHITRRRSVKEKRVAGNKIEKLLDVFPQVIFASGNISGARKLPGAALFCLPLTSKDGNRRNQKLQALQDVHAEYENAVVEIAASLQLSRNILIALLSLQSWKPFMQRWMRDSVILFDAKATSTALDKASKAANGIFKIMRRIAEESIPRSAENIALALGAFCEVLPQSAHAVKSTASKFLLGWLFQYEHEHRQWSAAVSLGLISSCLHVTDHKQKFQNIKALIEVASCSRSTLVKGACGVGLGFSCQDLLTRVEGSDDSNLEKETHKIQEVEILGKIVRVLSQMMCKLSPSLFDLLESISVYFPLATDDTDPYLTAESLDENCNDLEEDIWGIAGLVLGLGSSIGAIYRSGAHDVVHKIKAFIISWISNSNPLVQNSFGSEALDIVFSVGSCLALPSVVAFCQRVELINDTELDHLVSGLKELISEVLSVKKSCAFRQSLLMASCVGAGSLLACISNEGVHSLEVELVKDLLALFRECYSNPHPPLIPLGGMLGVVNALGAGAGTVVHNYPSTTLQIAYGQMDSFHIVGPLQASLVLEAQLTALIQEMFLVAQNSDDHQLQQHAAWAVSFLRHHLWFREFHKVDVSFPSNAAGQKSVSQNLPHDGVVMELSLWLMHLNYPGTGTFSHVNTVATVIRCLSQAPRLPALDWGAIVRRCMKYEGQVAELLSPNLAPKRGILREECLQLSLAHAKQLNPLLSFLDELSDLSRFRTLEINLQSWFLSHLADLIKVFSGSRLEKLFDDVANFFSSLLSNQVCNVEHKSSLRVSCWNGLYLCINETSLDSEVYVPIMEHCMEALFSSLPILHSAPASEGMELVHSVEWSAAVRCLARARQGWLFNLLQVPEGKIEERDRDFSEVVKKTRAKARLIKIGSIPLSDLGKLKVYLLNTKSDGIWDVLVDIVSALQHVEGRIKRQWLLDAVEISCVTCYPSTALQFLGLLCGSFSKYMPLLVLDPVTVLSDLPVTLSSLLLDNSSWGVAVESVVSYLWASTERIYDWERGFDTPTPYPPIDDSESDMAVFLLRVMHCACVSLRAYLPPEKQLKLANLMIP